MVISVRGAWSAVVRMLALVFAAGVLAGCASSFPPAPAAAADADYNYIIGPGDSVQIVVWRNPELSTSVPVRPDGKITAPVKGATLIGNGPDALTRVKMIGNDMALDPGIGNCGKDGQSVPVGVGQPTLRIDGGLTVGGTA